MNARYNEPTGSTRPSSPRAGLPARRAAGILAAALLILLGVTLATAPPPAQTAAPDVTYDLSWRTLDGGGAIFVQAGDYTLGGTIGQPDAGVPVTAGAYTLHGGFWGGAHGTYLTYLPAVYRGSPGTMAVVR